jgi:pimeloyl-ACP methyl ester carboxylesterase
MPLDQPLTREGLAKSIRQAAVVCERFWKEHNIDLTGYTTKENAADLDDLRKKLGAAKISLWGISYGSHLAFAALKYMEPGIDRVVIASAEGLDQTIKMPAHTDVFFQRFSATLRAANPGVATPDVPALMRRVQDRLERKPVSVPLKDKSGAVIATVGIGKYDVQFLTAMLIADPSATLQLIRLYEAMDRGDFGSTAETIRSFNGTGTITMRGMPEAMDIASGVSDAQLRMIEIQAEHALVGDLLNFPMPQLRGQLGVPDLGESFRSPVKTSVPTLLVMGSLDGRTYLEAQADNLQGFTRAHQIIVENAGHNVWMTSPEITPAVIAFLRGEQKLPHRLVAPPPRWLP